MDAKHNNVNQYDEATARFWKVLWSLNTFPKVNHFMWKCVTSIVPSGANLNSWVMEEKLTKYVILELKQLNTFLWSALFWEQYGWQHQEQAIVDKKLVYWYNDYIWWWLDTENCKYSLRYMEISMQLCISRYTTKPSWIYKVYSSSKWWYRKSNEAGKK